MEGMTMYLTDETMDELAQWQHDTAWETPESLDPEVIHESDIADCVCDDGRLHEYADKAGVFFKVWECNDCGKLMEVKA